MLTKLLVFPVIIFSVAIVLHSIVVVTVEMDFETATKIVKSQSVVMDIKEHEIPGTKELVNEVLTPSQMAEMEANHLEAVRVALLGIEALTWNLTGNDTYRRADGLGNNAQNPRWGGAFHFENRLLPASYSDGIQLPRTLAKSGDPLPSARTISVKCFLPSREENEFFDKKTSQLFFQLGQFLDHDIIATALTVAFNCCSASNHTTKDFSEEPCFPIHIEPGDRFFKTDCMNFRRAYGVQVNGVREQVNTATSFVDCSTIYGSTKEELLALRQLQRGLLKVTEDNMLPMSNYFPCVKRLIPQCPVSGDSRVSEVPGLSALHLVFHREHNRVATNLARVNPHWDDEKLFQEARKIVIALLQRIVYYEFLPKLIGNDVIEVLGINKPYIYDPLVNPCIMNVFGGAAFRFGHTLLSGIQYFKKGINQSLSELFFRPETVLYQGEDTVRDVVNNQARRLAHKYDAFFTTEITDRLYLGVDIEAEEGESFDLLARNIQRGRDHGLATYVEYMEYCMTKLKGIDGITELNLPTCFKTGVYQSITDIDIFVGGTYETPLTGAIVGPTFACIIGEQFRRLKFGDSFYFETPDRLKGFAPDQLVDIKETGTLSAIICRNTVVSSIQPRALDSRRSPENTKQPCSIYRDINFDLWREPQ